MNSRSLPVLLLVCTLTFLIAPPAQATIMKYLEIEDLARLSTDIFHGQVVSTDTYWNQEHTRIYTAVRVSVNESFKGSTRRAEIVTVTQLGGQRDGIRMDYAGRPEFEAGESVVLFTARGKGGGLTVVGLKQGKMNLVGDEIRRDFTGITIVDSLDSTKALRPAALKPTRIRLDDLRNRIGKAR